MNTELIRKIRKEDMVSIVHLWAIHEGKDRALKREEGLQWLLGGNPFSKDKNDYYVMEDKGRVVAYEGLMPHVFSLMGKDVDGFIYQDTMVDPDMRGQGLGYKIVKGVGERNSEFSIAVWMNEPNGRLYEKCGWQGVEGLPTLVRGYNVSKIFHTGNKVIDRSLLAIMNRIISAIYKIEKMTWCLSKSNLSIETIELFDDRITDFFHSIKNHYPYITHRTKDVLNWKYSHSPFTEFFKFICTKDGEVLGYMVFRAKKMEDGRFFGTVIDFLCAPERKDVFTALLRSSILEMEKKKVDYIDILTTVKSYKKNLLKMGFIKTSNNRFALKYLHAGDIDNEKSLRKGENWFFTFGDGDMVFWDY